MSFEAVQEANLLVISDKTEGSEKKQSNQPPKNRNSTNSSDKDRKMKLQYYKLCEDYKILFDENENNKRL